MKDLSLLHFCLSRVVLQAEFNRRLVARCCGLSGVQASYALLHSHRFGCVASVVSLFVTIGNG